jgi:hypothetical protein
MIFFEAGSDRLDQQAQDTLLGFARSVQESGEDGHFEVEASAPGDGTTYDRALALRRANQMKRLLQQHGFGNFDIEVRLQSFFGIVSIRNEPSEARDEYERQANVRFWVREASEFIGPGMYRECW